MQPMLLPCAIPPEWDNDPVGRRVQEWMRKTPLRLTIGRMAVVKVLVQAQTPVDAEAVLRGLVEQGSPTSLATVYRILKELEQHALVEREWHHNSLGTRSCYAVKLGPQHKRVCCFQCDVCGRRRKVAEPALATQLAAAAEHEGYNTQQELVVVSRCAACSKN